MEIVAFGGGCFWCTEAVFGILQGVVSVRSGYAGGSTPNPTYESVSSGTTGHAEVLQVEYDSSIISFPDLLKVFFESHDPTTLNRQGADTGTQYRSIILYTNPKQKEESDKYIEFLKASGMAVVTEVKELEKFFPAEDYHQNYYQNHEGGVYAEVVIEPKLKKIKDKFGDLIDSVGKDFKLD
ncbi:MAG: peptide-methionine (S)-S-oxide reductase MsrA [Candidatus Pacebacteria bacterium]|nr:peptide-methionine (S)-S-oxide reductase MsrA [Candidatus Paceibacterota bacterium]